MGDGTGERGHDWPQMQTDRDPALEALEHAWRNGLVAGDGVRDVRLLEPGDLVAAQ